MLSTVQGGGGLKHAPFTSKEDLAFMPGLNSTAVVSQPIVTETLCNNNNKKSFFFFLRRNKLNCHWQILYPSYIFKIVFPIQRTDTSAQSSS